MSVIIRVNVLESRSTDQALYISNPKNITRFLFIPRSVVISKRRVEGTVNKFDIEIKSWFAENEGF